MKLLQTVLEIKHLKGEFRKYTVEINDLPSLPPPSVVFNTTEHIRLSVCLQRVFNIHINQTYNKKGGRVGSGNFQETNQTFILYNYPLLLSCRLAL